MSKFTQGKWKIEAFDIVDEYHIPIAQIPHIGRLLHLKCMKH